MNSTTFVSLNSWYSHIVIAYVLQMIGVPVFKSSLLFIWHETKNQKLKKMFWYYYIFCFVWKEVDFYPKQSQSVTNSCKTFQNWLCSYQASMKPTTAIPRPFSPLPQQLIWREEFSQHLEQQLEYIHQYPNVLSWIYGILLADNIAYI